MVSAIVFLLELLSLFFLSRLVTRSISSLIFKITKSQVATINTMAFLFFPGTLIHELSHLIMAGILFVPVGHIELWPKLEGQHIKLGSVAIGVTDIFRRFLIGAAPFIFGTLLLLGLLFYAAQNNLFVNQFYIFLLAYVAFEVGNTMFSSQKDMEGALEFLAALIWFGAVFYFLGIRLPAGNIESFFADPIITQAFQQGSLYLLVPLTIDTLLLLIIRFFFFRRV